MPVDCDGIPPRHPSDADSAAALAECEAREDSLLDVDDADYDPYAWMDSVG
jgi:hypothetical protein